MNWYYPAAGYSPQYNYPQQSYYPQQQSYYPQQGYYQQDPWAAYYAQQAAYQRPQQPGGFFPGGGMDDFVPSSRPSAPEPAPSPPMEQFIPQMPPQEMMERKKSGGIFGMVKTAAKWLLMAAGVYGIYAWFSKGDSASGAGGKLEPSATHVIKNGRGDDATFEPVYERRNEKGKVIGYFRLNEDGQAEDVARSKVVKNPDVADADEPEKPAKSKKKKRKKP